MKITPQAKKVFEGVFFDVYQWEQEMFDGTKATFEMLKRMDTVEIFATNSNQILYAHEEQPYRGPFTTLFCGKLEKGELPIDAAKRELAEESGLASDDWELLYTYEPSSRIEWTVHVYAARNCQKIQEATPDAGEKISVQSADFDTFFDVAISPSFRSKEIARRLLQMKFLEPETFEEFKKKIFGK